MLKGPKTTRVTIAPFMAPNEHIHNRSPKLEKLQPFVRPFRATSSTDQSDDEFFSAYEENAMVAVTEGIPVSYKDMASDEAHYLKEAMDSEMKSIRDNVTYKLDVLRFSLFFTQ
jgi:hypothetical protein